MKFTLAAFISIATAVNGLPILDDLRDSIIFPSVYDFAQQYINIPFEHGIENLEEGRFEELPLINTNELQYLIEEEGLKLGAETLFNISTSSVKRYGNPTRVIGSPGHWKTIHYIVKELRKLKGYYKVWTQSFKALDGKVFDYSLLLNGTQPPSVEPFSMTPATLHKRPVHGNLVLVDNYGCDISDFPSIANGNIVLIKRGECPFGDKSSNAGLSGAKGAIIYDASGPISGTLGSPTGNEVATVGISEQDAKKYIDALTENPTAFIETTLYVDAYVKNITTLNVLAETVQGDHDNVIALGAHSDSVSAGPGINDDGSGTISLLEVAKKLSNFKVNNAVRFAWWAAEEEGLLGSDHYANSLTPEENSKIRLFMDYDMMASPNYEYQIYDANNEDHPNGSGDLKDLYIDYYTANGLNYTLVPFDGRSDYVGFIDNGIPAGGIATGAEGVKSEEGVEKFGGVAGEWFDQCYHQLCDNTTNPNYDAWLVNTRLIAHSVATYANSTVDFPPREPLVSLQSTKSSDKFVYRGSKLII